MSFSAKNNIIVNVCVFLLMAIVVLAVVLRLLFLVDTGRIINVAVNFVEPRSPNVLASLLISRHLLLKAPGRVAV